MPTPTVGRIVHYKPTSAQAEVYQSHEGAPLAAMVVGVQPDGLLNLAVYSNSSATPAVWVTPAVPERDEAASVEEGRWFWPPRA